MTARTIASCRECGVRYLDWADGPSGCPKCYSMNITFDETGKHSIAVRPELDALCALVNHLDDKISKLNARLAMIGKLAGGPL